MGYDECLQLLEEDIKKLDERVEEERNHYARLLAGCSRHEEEQRGKEWQKETLAGFFAYVAEGNEYERESVHLQTLSGMIEEEKREQEEYQAQIEERKNYYEALRNKKIYPLIEDGSIEGMLAAVFFLYDSYHGTPYQTLEYIEGDIGPETPEEVLRYLIEKSFVYNEELGYSEDDDKMVALIEKWVDSAAPSGGDSRWQSIRQLLKLRRTRSVDSECSWLVDRYERCIRDFNRLSSDYRTAGKTMQEELDRLDASKSGKEVRERVREVAEWYQQSRSELNREMMKRMGQTTTIESNLVIVKSLQEEIRSGREEGLEKRRCSEILSLLQQMEQELDKVIPVSSLEAKERELLKQFQKKISQIQSAREAEMQKEKEAERLKVTRRENDRRRRREFWGDIFFWVWEHKLLCFLMTAAVVIGVTSLRLDAKAKSAPLWQINDEGELSANCWHNINKKSYLSALWGSVYEMFHKDDNDYSLEDFYFPEKLQASMEEEGVLELPAEVDGQKVTGIAFLGLPGEKGDRVGVKKIIVPEGVTTWRASLYKNEEVEEIVLPSSLTRIASGSFALSNLTTINLEHVEQIGEKAFNASRIKEARLLSAKQISDSAFLYIQPLERVYLPVVERIGYRAFGECKRLEEIYIGDSIQEMGKAPLPVDDDPDYHVVLDANGQYSEEIMNQLETFLSGGKLHFVELQYADFAELGLADR